MARNDAVWGIDIGQCALKALRCRLVDGTVQADAFDYVEYPKILSQPEADPVALVQEALKQFLSRNSVRGDKVAVSVPGQSGLARFIKLPPVESKKIPNIVKYEAKQQIPFALEDVIWDYQKMVGGSEEEGFALETEVGLFAMKRDQVYRALKPFTDAGIEVDYIQLTPLAIYNFVAFDQMKDLPPPEEYDPENPPESTVVISLGTDSTDLVVTNGYRVWQRSVPIGGNHFTKALTKELKLTFATAEHLKRNAAKAEDPKALFQAMRPVFNDLLTEVQRSIGYFTNLDRRAKIGKALAMGNAMKLPGLQRYLSQNLGLDLVRVESLSTLGGPTVVDAPAFKENVLSFGVPYGLALQGLRQAKIKTNLIPQELVKDRMIRAKKPWAVGAAAALLLGFTISYFGEWRVWNSVRTGPDLFGPAVAKADSAVKMAENNKAGLTTARDGFKKTEKIHQSLFPIGDDRTQWVELMKVVSDSLPSEPAGVAPPKDLALREQINLTHIDCARVADLGTWWTSVQKHLPAAPVAVDPNAVSPTGAAAADGTTPPAATPDAAAATPPASPDAAAPAPAMPAADGSMPAADGTAPPGPTGPGWIIQLTGHHYHNSATDVTNQGDLYVKNTLIKNLQAYIDAKPAPDGKKKLPIAHPVIITRSPINREYTLQLPYELVAELQGKPLNAAALAQFGNPTPGMLVPHKQARYDFIVQLCWPDPAPPPAAGEGAEAADGSAPAADAPVAVPPVAAPPEAVPATTPAPAAAPPAGDGASPPAAPANGAPAEGAPANGVAPATEPPPADGATPSAAPEQAPPAAPPANDGGAAPPPVAPPTSPPASP